MNGIIFDLDGTLWEVIDSTKESADVITKKHNLPEITRKTICSVFGLGKYDSARKYFPNIEINKAMELLDEIAKVNIQNLREKGGNIYPNIEKTLLVLKNNFNLYIVSNTAETEYIEAFLESSKLKRYFTDWIAASSLNLTKGEAIQKIIKDNNIINSVYVGDTSKDLEATLEANIPFIHVRYGFEKDLNCKYNINDFSELPAVIEKVTKR